MRPDAGQILVSGDDITTFDEARMDGYRRRFGMFFQMGALLNSLSVHDNIALPLREHTELDEKIIGVIVKMKLELVGLRDFEHLKPAQLSGGMQKRVALARALALDPEIVFYDEPTSGLDPVVTGVISQLILDLSKRMGITSVVVTHDTGSAFKIADKMVVCSGTGRRGRHAQTDPGIVRSAGSAVYPWKSGRADSASAVQQGLPRRSAGYGLLVTRRHSLLTIR